MNVATEFALLLRGFINLPVCAYATPTDKASEPIDATNKEAMRATCLMLVVGTDDLSNLAVGTGNRIAIIRAPLE